MLTTAASPASIGNKVFLSRMFALETLMKSLQASPHEGTLFMSWNKDEEVVNIGGEVVIWGKGKVFI